MRRGLDPGAGLTVSAACVGRGSLDFGDAQLRRQGLGWTAAGRSNP